MYRVGLWNVVRLRKAREWDCVLKYQEECSDLFCVEQLQWKLKWKLKLFVIHHPNCFKVAFE